MIIAVWKKMYSAVWNKYVDKKYQKTEIRNTLTNYFYQRCLKKNKVCPNEILSSWKKKTIFPAVVFPFWLVFCPSQNCYLHLVMYLSVSYIVWCVTITRICYTIFFCLFFFFVWLEDWVVPLILDEQQSCHVAWEESVWVCVHMDWKAQTSGHF